jgi:hypothetical protein
MTLKETIEKLWELAENEPNINTIIKSNDIYELNQRQDIKYGAFCITQNVHQEFPEAENPYRQYTLYLYYVDRLQSDKSNNLQIQSHGIEVLSDILRKFEEVSQATFSTTIQYTPFQQRFESECSGVYATVSIISPLTNNC